VLHEDSGKEQDPLGRSDRLGKDIFLALFIFYFSWGVHGDHSLQGIYDSKPLSGWRCYWFVYTLS